MLKDNEIKEHGLDERGMWRTQRRVLEAYDRFANDDTFDPARLEDPEYFPVVRAALKIKARRATRPSAAARAGAQLEGSTGPTRPRCAADLFVEGETDKLIVEGAWRALFPWLAGFGPAGGRHDRR